MHLAPKPIRLRLLSFRINPLPCICDPYYPQPSFSILALGHLEASQAFRASTVDESTRLSGPEGISLQVGEETSAVAVRASAVILDAAYAGWADASEGAGVLGEAGVQGNTGT